MKSKALDEVVSTGNSEIVQFLLDNGTNPNYKYYWTQSPLKVAIRNGNYNLIEMLLRANADPNFCPSKDDIPVRTVTVLLMPPLSWNLLN